MSDTESADAGLISAKPILMIKETLHQDRDKDIYTHLLAIKMSCLLKSERIKWSKKEKNMSDPNKI